MEGRTRRVAVTGAAGGLGGAIAAGLVADGVEVIGLDRREAAAGWSITVDVTDPGAVGAAFATLAAEGPLDGLVVAHGIQLHGADGPVADVSLDVWQQTVAVNQTGAFLVLRAAVPLLLAAGGSSVVLVGSPTGLTMSGAGYAAYAASKAGMMALARVTAADYADRGLRANVVVPGTMRTPLIEPLLADEASRASLLAGLPIGRLGEPDDLLGVVRWLLSDAAGFATGGFYPVDGGLTAR